MHRLNKIVWIIILALISGIMGILILDGNIELYLSPRIVPMVFFGCAVLLILLIYNICVFKSNKEHGEHTVFRLRSLIFIIPIVLFISVTPDMSTVNALPDQNLDLSRAAQVIDDMSNEFNSPEVGGQDQVEQTKDDENEDTDSLMQQKEQLIDVSEMPPCVLIDGDDDALEQGGFEEYIYLSLDEMMGRNVNLYGFVYKDDSFPKNTILISRLMVSCCIADSSMVGYQVKVENVDDFEEDQWIEVTGVVDKFILNMYGKDYELPIITEGTIVKKQAPSLDKWYVYPN